MQTLRVIWLGESKEEAERRWRDYEKRSDKERVCKAELFNFSGQQIGYVVYVKED